MRRWALLLLAVAPACKPSDAAVARYRAAYASAKERVAKAEASLDAAVVQLRDGKWVAGKGEPGSCAVKVADRDVGYGLRSSSDWSQLRDRIFEHRGVGDGTYDQRAKDDEDLDQSTAYLGKAMKEEDDVLFMYVDEEVEPKITGGSSYQPGHDRGRAWAYSFAKGAVTCAGTFHAESSDQVEARIFDEGHADTDRSVALTLDLWHRATKSAIAGFVPAELQQ